MSGYDIDQVLGGICDLHGLELLDPHLKLLGVAALQQLLMSDRGWAIRMVGLEQAPRPYTGRVRRLGLHERFPQQSRTLKQFSRPPRPALATFLAARTPR
jgi:hypothetical protein